MHHKFSAIFNCYSSPQRITFPPRPFESLNHEILFTLCVLVCILLAILNVAGSKFMTTYHLVLTPQSPPLDVITAKPTMSASVSTWTIVFEALTGLLLIKPSKSLLPSIAWEYSGDQCLFSQEQPLHLRSRVCYRVFLFLL